MASHQFALALWFCLLVSVVFRWKRRSFWVASPLFVANFVLKQLQQPQQPRLDGSHMLSSYTTLHYVTLRYTTLHYVTLRYTTLHYVTLRYTTLHYVTLRYTTLHYVTLRYTTLHYVTLRYTSTWLESYVFLFTILWVLDSDRLRSPAASLSMSLSTGHRCRRDVLLDLPDVSIGSCCPSWWSPRSWESVWIFAH